MPCVPTMPCLHATRCPSTRATWSRSLSPAPSPAPCPETLGELSVTAVHHKDGPSVGDSFVMGSTNTPNLVRSVSREAAAPVGDRSDHVGLHLHGSMGNTIPPYRASFDSRATTHQATKTNQASKGFNGEWRYTVMQYTDEAVEHLKTLHEEYFAQMKSNLEARILDVEQRVIADRQSQTNMAMRLRAIEENGAEHVDMISNIRNRVSVIERSIDGISLADVHKLTDQHIAKQEEESRNMKADLENRLHNMEETITQIFSSRVEQGDDVMKLKDAFEGRIAGIEDYMDRLCETHSSEITNLYFILQGMEARFCKDGSTHAQPDTHSLFLRTKFSSRELPAYEDGGCASALRLAVKALSDAVGIAPPLGAIPGMREHAAMCVPEDESAALPIRDATTNLANKPADVHYGSVSETHLSIIIC